MSILDTALAWHQVGVAVIPVKTDGTKAPALKTWKRYQTQRPTIDELLQWFGDPDTPGIGILTGATSGNLEMIEIEGAAIQDGALALVQQYADDNDLRQLLDRVIDGYSEATPSGGIHILYFIDGTVGPNTKLARDAGRHTLAETRGEGGFVVVAPSHGPVHDTGRPWQMIAGHPNTVAHVTEDEAGALHALLSMLNTEPPREEHAQAPDLFGTHNGTRPGDDYANKTTWSDILEPRGWTIVRRMGNGYAWRRPGKNLGVSATTGQADDGVDRLYVFSSSTDFEPERPYSKFAAYALLEHNGDYAAAARALSSLGYGSQPTITSTPTPTATPAATPAGTVMTQTIEAPEVVETLAMTEDGHALHLINAVGERVRYCDERGRWLYWDGWRWHWQSSKGGKVREFAKDIARSYPDDKPWLAHKRRCLSSAGTTACLIQASTDDRVAITTDALDAHPWELNTPGGIIDLRSGTLTPPDPARLHTKITNVSPDFTADRTEWLQFLHTTFMGDQAIIDWIQRLLGYACIGEVREHILPVFYGQGANGKTVLLDTVSSLLGDYAAPAPSGFLMSGLQQHATEVAALAGVRIIVSSESNAGQHFDEAKIKQLTGGDRIKARFMRQDEFTFVPSHTIFLMTNHRPEVAAGGYAFWRRIREVPFNHEVPLEQRDPELQTRLVTEHGPAIMAWLAEGAAKYAASGLAEPDKITSATSSYERDTDTVARFVDDVCIIGGGDLVKVNSVAVRAAYESWCRSEGETPISAKAMNQALRGRYSLGNVKSNGSRFYTNVSLLSGEGDEATAWMK